MAIKRPDTPLAPTPEPITDRVQSVMESREKQNNGKYSALNKEKVTIDSSDCSSAAQFTKQTYKENGNQKFKQYRNHAIQIPASDQRLARWLDL